jgi:peroxiredoxin Q/BCP
LLGKDFFALLKGEMRMVTIEEGSRAPDFSLPDSQEKEISLKDFQGNWLVLYFYPKDNTSGCTQEALDFNDLRGEFEKLGARILGISPDSSASHRKFAEKHGLAFPLLSDPEKSVLQIYGAWGTKKNYGKEYQGVIRSTFLISPEGIIKGLWRNVKVRTKRKTCEVLHAATVLEKLQTLQGIEPK